MDLKNAVAVCLISLFSATIVVLIARALDSQSASQLEPQLASIVEELRAIRKQGGVPMGTAAEAVDEGLMVYYFHDNNRCADCELIESQTRETVETHFPGQLSSGEITWKTLNRQKPEGRPLGKKFQVHLPVVVLARMKDGEVEQWARLDKVWALKGDKTAFREYVLEEINRMLASDKEAAPDASKTGAPGRPVLKAGDSHPAAPKQPPAIPIPQ